MLFSDVEGSTSLLKQLGDGWPDALERLRAILREAVDAREGVVVDCQGDALFAAFHSAGDAVAAAVESQRAIAREGWPAGVELRVRMGIHSGEPARTSDGYAGLDVVRAARLCAAGHGGQILISETARLLSGATSVALGQVRLAGIDEPEVAHQLVGEGLPSTFPPLRGGAQGGELDAMGERRRSAEDQIGEAASRLEERISAQVARSLDRLWSGRDAGRGDR
jgi:class 3 adenylate cyclase